MIISNLKTHSNYLVQYVVDLNAANNKTLSPLSEDFILNSVMYRQQRFFIYQPLPAAQSSHIIFCCITIPDLN